MDLKSNKKEIKGHKKKSSLQTHKESKVENPSLKKEGNYHVCLWGLFLSLVSPHFS